MDNYKQDDFDLILGKALEERSELMAADPVTEKTAVKSEKPAKAPGRKVSEGKRGRPKKGGQLGKHVVYLPDDAYFALLQYKARARVASDSFQGLGDILREATLDFIKKSDKNLYESLQISK